jgi:type IV secretion system protein TrbL
LGIKAGNANITDQQFYNPGKVVATGWSGAWNMVQAATKLTGVRATFVNLPQIVIIMLAAIIYFLAFALLAFQIFLALVQFKAGALASFVLLPMALLNKTVFLAERPIGWLFASGIRLMILALVMALGLDLVQSVASVPADALTIRQAVAAALGAVSLFLLARMATAMSGDLVSGAPSLGIDGGGAIGPAARAARGAAGNAASTARGAAPYAGRALRWGAMAVASLVPGGGAAATAGRAAVSTASVAGGPKDAGTSSAPIRVSVRRRMPDTAPTALLPGPSQA